MRQQTKATARPRSSHRRRRPGCGQPEPSAGRADEQQDSDGEHGDRHQLQVCVGPAHLFVAGEQDEGADRGAQAAVEKDRQPDATRAVPQEGVEEGVADNPDEHQQRHADERERVETVAGLVGGRQERQVPERPQHPEQKRRTDRRQSLLQPRQREPAPAGLLADARERPDDQYRQIAGQAFAQQRRFDCAARSQERRGRCRNEQNREADH